ncbi:hypothetical protein BC835DRAFT_646493 [Cytidiella melzeri]|nr:hypothetical protein BC835DRAFT_646493 [Cytidiella melzeri]
MYLKRRLLCGPTSIMPQNLINFQRTERCAVSMRILRLVGTTRKGPSISSTTNAVLFYHSPYHRHDSSSHFRNAPDSPLRTTSPNSCISRRTHSVPTSTGHSLLGR